MSKKGFEDLLSDLFRNASSRVFHMDYGVVVDQFRLEPNFTLSFERFSRICNQIQNGPTEFISIKPDYSTGAKIN